MTDQNTQNTNQSSQSNQQNTQTPPRTFYEELSVAGNQLVSRIESMIKEGNIRRLIVKDANGRTLVEMPLTIGAVAATSLAYFAMPLAVLGTIAALVARVQVIIERYENPADAELEQEKDKIEIK